MDYSPWSEKEIWPNLKAISLKQKRLHPPNLINIYTIIERKPKLNRKPELRTVCAVVRTARWHQLGIQLGVDTQMLDDIKIEKSETQEKMTQMFRLWLAKSTRSKSQATG